MPLAERQSVGALNLEVPTSDEAPAVPSLDAVYRTHAPTVARWVAHLGGPSIDVEDVLHEIFLVVRRQLPRFRGEAKITTWLYSITSRVVLNWRRKDRFRRFVRRTRRDDLEHSLTANQPTPVELLERSQTGAQVYRVLDRLPEKYRQVLVLFELEGLSGEEIAALSGVKLATVWVHLHRARAAFLATMNQLEGDRR
jgi:RNA polymerase sigma-70 factor (ECF subfamily)